MRTEVVFLSGTDAVEFGVVHAWLFKVGNTVEEGQSLVEVEAEKAIIEIPAPASGVLVEILAEEGDEVNAGGPLGVIEG
jgi:pyruvate/2-oxoglutarate dehydrogenase complex dihydrolipoamide acyltransferase (E2) component